mmetsp:Transcript_57316/g.178135  ORF Transcript_57316/g.178135 Transcript_57316/m.178135 type:complete len:193 (-) Transcript_57316:69-647(-)
MASNRTRAVAVVGMVAASATGALAFVQPAVTRPEFTSFQEAQSAQQALPSGSDFAESSENANTRGLFLGLALGLVVGLSGALMPGAAWAEEKAVSKCGVRRGPDNKPDVKACWAEAKAMQKAGNKPEGWAKIYSQPTTSVGYLPGSAKRAIHKEDLTNFNNWMAKMKPFMRKPGEPMALNPDSPYRNIVQRQ